MMSLVYLALAGLGAVALLVVAGSRFLVIAQPDEWLLCVRNGRLVKAAVGVYIWRRPGDVVARFTSTMQRVAFTVDALSSERLRVRIEGFILWSVSPVGEGPFRAFRKLGLVNLNAPPRDLKSPKHLLSPPQHRAFKQLLGAGVQRLAATKSLDELLLRQEGLIVDLDNQLAVLGDEMGIRFDQVEILKVRPVDEELLRRMSAGVEETVREEADLLRLDSTERVKRRAVESEARIAQQEAQARQDELERQKTLRLAQVTHDHEVKLATEASALEVTRAVIEREELELTARLNRIRREAEANRDAISAVTSAEESKSQAVRDHELGRLVAEKVGDALRELPLHDARWITIGPDSPAGTFASWIAAARELTAFASKTAPP